jgi:hypothetical protein
MPLSLAFTACNRAADAVCARCNNGRLRLYSGVMPATANVALAGNTQLSEHAFASPAFAAAVNGMATANAIGTSVPTGSGTATFFRTFEADQTTVVYQGTAGTVGTDLLLNGATFVQGQGTIKITSHTYTQPPV